MVMIDTLSGATDRTADTALTIAADNIFLNGGKFSPSGLLENMAQTAAAHAGYLALRLNEPVKVGFIGAVKDLQIKSLPPAGATLHTHIEVQNTVFNATSVLAKVSLDNAVVASCELKIFINP
ncbi:3-hydroxyacyl-ACP dehydratase [Chitinophaga parva]|uniref:3-hydroxyacyl-ACP dehydratase n=2 Tax=Chitinophaga parva TaxID=2169414 RepID=A0A2T7BFS0_9BACT|nr:3-hydroxyacyl-ACP dehydratase [Chitinophaga parva]